jgi:hypothetical protein
MGSFKLKPCPWCGGPVEFEQINMGDTGNVRWSIGCNDAEAECFGFQSLTSFARKEDAAGAWNKRLYIPDKE